nr:ScyD/ScyE family protein [Conyzicola lurida]
MLVPSAACAALLVSAVAVAGPAAAGGGGTPTAGPPTTVASGFVAPLSLEIDSGRVAYLSQNFTGQLTRVARDGTVTELASAPGQEISAVSTRDGVVYYAQVAMDHSAAALMAVPAAGGAPTQVADLFAYESTANPDSGQSYGFQGLPAECAAQFPPPGGMVTPPEYTGIVDTHPYASLALNNAVFVADAGMNAVLRVGYDGAVSTVAVLPAQPAITATAEFLATVGLPACAAGYDYITEAVPTDVEIGPDGWLYVTTLPGGPEDPSFGARGSVYKVNQKSGEVRLLATGFVGATGLAVSPAGNVYVAELFGGPTGGGQISALWKGSTTPTPLTQVPSPAAIEVRSNRLFVTTDALSETGGASLSLIEVAGAK